MTRLCKYPYPYRAALAIASDIDECSPERFVEIHEHLNEKLGLDIADSFFCTASKDQLNWEDHREVIFEGMRRGWIDTIHGIGDYNRMGGFKRSVSRRYLAELAANGIRLEIFSNHGDPDNAQNLFHTGGRGDVKGSEEYHADLLTDYGVKFVWPTWLTHLVGQDRSANAWEWARTYPNASTARRIGAGLLAIFGFVGMVDRYPGNELVRLHTLRDGQQIYAFRRHGIWRRDDVPALAEFISAERIEELIELRGAQIIYTHLGRRWSPIPQFEYLKKFKELWIVRTSRLLRYVVVREGLKWKARGGTVKISAHEDPVLGKITAKDLVGFTFEGATTITLDDVELPVVTHESKVVEVAAS